jgi:chromosome segregation ATPase
LLGCGKWESCRDAGHPSEQRDVCDRITAELERLDADNARLTLDLVAANGRVEYEALGARNASAHCKEAWAERDDWEGASKLGHEALQTLVDDYNAVVAERDAARKSLAEMTESYRIAINTSAEFVKEIDQLRARLEAPAKDGGK